MDPFAFLDKAKEQVIGLGLHVADRALGGWLPGGGVPSPITPFIIRNNKKLAGDIETGFYNATSRHMDSGVNMRKQHLEQGENERQAQIQMSGGTPSDEYLSGFQQTNLNAAKEGKYCPVNRDAWNLAKAAGANYRMNTQNTPKGGKMGCVEAVQRTFADSNIGRVPRPPATNILQKAERLIRTDAGDTKELVEGLRANGAYYIDPKTAGPGDVAISGGAGDPYGSHTGIVSTKVDENGFPLVTSNSGSHGTMSHVFPVGGKYGPSVVLRLGEKPEGLAEYDVVGEYQKQLRRYDTPDPVRPMPIGYPVGRPLTRSGYAR